METYHYYYNYNPALVIVGVSVLFTFGGVSSSICCVPDQLEAVLIYDLGQCFIDTDTAYSFTNSTVRMAYDYTNKRMYLNITALEISPLIPQPVTERTAMIYDYAKGMQYTLDAKSCSKDKLTEPMSRMCIPDNAVLQSTFSMGSNDLLVKMYSFISSGDLKAKMRATINPKTCIPVAQEWILGSSESDSGTLNQVQVMNVTRGIKNDNIFTPPKSCSKVSSQRPFSKNRTIQKFEGHFKAGFFFG